MILEKNELGTEFTEELLIDTLTNKFTSKKTDKPFTKNDLVQYQLRGRLPKKYGGNRLTVLDQFGVKILLVEGEI